MRKKIKRETAVHMEAYAYYLTLGGKRNLIKVSQKYIKSIATVQKWSMSFNWQERIEKFEEGIKKKIEKEANEKTSKLICNDIEKLTARKSDIVNSILQDLFGGSTRDKKGVISDVSPKAMSVSEKKKAWEILKTELKEPTSITKNENENTDKSYITIQDYEDQE